MFYPLVVRCAYYALRRGNKKTMNTEKKHERVCDSISNSSSSSNGNIPTISIATAGAHRMLRVDANAETMYMSRAKKNCIQANHTENMHLKHNAASI